jgi:hypothetical protein
VTPSPQTTEGLGATPLTAEEEAACRWAAATFGREPNGRLILRLLATLDRERAAARLSVPSEALAEARETVIAKARTLLADSGRTRAISEARTALDDALYEYDAILAALPNREDDPEPPDVDRLAFAMEARDVQCGGSPHITPGNRFYREQAAALIALMPPPVREDAPSREGLDAEQSCLGCGQVREPSAWDAQSHAYLCVECVFAIRWTPALDELVSAALEFNNEVSPRLQWAGVDDNNGRLWKALDPFRYCYPVPESYHGPFAEGATPCGDRTLYLGRARLAALAATPPGDREDGTPPIAMPTVTHRAAVATAEAAAREEG